MCSAFLEKHLAELEEYLANPEIMAIVNKTLPCDGEPIDFGDWMGCLKESVRDHKAVIDEWARK